MAAGWDRWLTYESTDWWSPWRFVDNGTGPDGLVEIDQHWHNHAPCHLGSSFHTLGIDQSVVGQPIVGKKRRPYRTGYIESMDQMETVVDPQDIRPWWLLVPKDRLDWCNKLGYSVQPWLLVDDNWPYRWKCPMVDRLSNYRAIVSTVQSRHSSSGAYPGVVPVHLFGSRPGCCWV